MKRDVGQQHTVVSISQLSEIVKPPHSQREPSVPETAAPEFFRSRRSSPKLDQAFRMLITLKLHQN